LHSAKQVFERLTEHHQIIKKSTGWGRVLPDQCSYELYNSGGLHV